MQTIGYKNHARVSSSVVDASLKIACAADGVRKGPIFLLLYRYILLYGNMRKLCRTLHVLYRMNLFLMIFN